VRQADCGVADQLDRALCSTFCGVVACERGFPRAPKSIKVVDVKSAFPDECLLRHSRVRLDRLNEAAGAADVAVVVGGQCNK
jgi:hypothetical protein